MSHRTGAPTSPSVSRPNIDLVDKRVPTVEFEAVTECEREIAHGGIGIADKPYSSPRRIVDQIRERGSRTKRIKGTLIGESIFEEQFMHQNEHRVEVGYPRDSKRWFQYHRVFVPLHCHTAAMWECIRSPQCPFLAFLPWQRDRTGSGGKAI